MPTPDEIRNMELQRDKLLNANKEIGGHIRRMSEPAINLLLVGEMKEALKPVLKEMDKCLNGNHKGHVIEPGGRCQNCLWLAYCGLSRVRNFLSV